MDDDCEHEGIGNQNTDRPRIFSYTFKKILAIFITVNNTDRLRPALRQLINISNFFIRLEW